MAIFTMRMRKLSLYALTILMLTLLSCGNQRRGSVNIGDSGFSLERGTPISEGHTLSASPDHLGMSCSIKIKGTYYLYFYEEILKPSRFLSQKKQSHTMPCQGSVWEFHNWLPTELLPWEPIYMLCHNCDTDHEFWGTIQILSYLPAVENNH
jgi:hypothetical protein